MAVALVSDIVMDVVKAADPDAVRAARARLAERAQGAGAASAPFAPRAGEAETPVASSDRAVALRETAKKFEAMVLQSFLQNMMPKEAEAVYGSGLSGDMWKALMAEKIADAVAESGGIGIARQMLADHYLEGERKVPLAGVNTDPGRAELDRQAMLSAALIQEIQRTVMLANERDGSAGPEAA